MVAAIIVAAFKHNDQTSKSHMLLMLIVRYIFATYPNKSFPEEADDHSLGPWGGSFSCFPDTITDDGEGGDHGLSTILYQFSWYVAPPW